MSGWIKWEAKEGDVRPVADDAVVDVFFPEYYDVDHRAEYGNPADSWIWTGTGNDRLSHYRIHDGTNPPPPSADECGTNPTAPGSDAEMIAELVAALKPFASAGDDLSRPGSKWLDHEDQWRGDMVYLTVGDLRRAAAAIHKAESRQ